MLRRLLSPILARCRLIARRFKYRRQIELNRFWLLEASRQRRVDDIRYHTSVLHGLTEDPRYAPAKPTGHWLPEDFLGEDDD